MFTYQFLAKTINSGISHNFDKNLKKKNRIKC